MASLTVYASKAVVFSYFGALLWPAH